MKTAWLDMAGMRMVEQDVVKRRVSPSIEYDPALPRKIFDLRMDFSGEGIVL